MITASWMFGVPIINSSRVVSSENVEVSNSISRELRQSQTVQIKLKSDRRVPISHIEIIFRAYRIVRPAANHRCFQ